MFSVHGLLGSKTDKTTVERSRQKTASYRMAYKKHRVKKRNWGKKHTVPGHMLGDSTTKQALPPNSPFQSEFFSGIVH